MSIELLSLYVFCATLLATLMAQAIVLVTTTNFAYASSNRDRQVDNPHPMLGRLERALRNSIEAAVIFAPLVFIATQVGVSNDITQWSAMAFAASRILYAVSYALGITGVRTIIWNIGTTAIATFGAGILLG